MAQAVIRFMMPSPNGPAFQLFLEKTRELDPLGRRELGGQAVGCSRPCGHALPSLVIEILGKRMDQSPGFVVVDLGEHIFARIAVVLGLQRDRRRF